MIDRPLGSVALREYIEALLREKERALDMAAAERDRAAEVLRDEQRRATQTAEAEREKAAAALRAGTDRAIADNYHRLRDEIQAATNTLSLVLEEKERATSLATEEREKAAAALQVTLTRSVAEGDDRLREHIANQVDRIRADLESSEKLELARIAAVAEQAAAERSTIAQRIVDAEVHAKDRLAGMQREVTLQAQAAETAVEKALAAQQIVNAGQNEFRQTLNDHAATLMPRKEVEVLLNEQARQITEGRDALAVLRTDIAVGPAGLGVLQSQQARQQGEQQGRSTLIEGGLGAVVAVAAVLAILISLAGLLVTLTH